VATHFFAPAAQAFLGRSAHGWASGTPLAEIGGLQFYAPSGSAKREAIKLADEVSAWIAARDAAWRQASASKLARPKGRELAAKNNQSRYHENDY
jgi:hypothetical protein